MGIKTTSVILAIGVMGGLSFSGAGSRGQGTPPCEPITSPSDQECNPEDFVASLREDAGAAAAFTELIAALDGAIGSEPGQYGFDDVLNDLRRMANSGAVTALIEQER